MGCCIVNDEFASINKNNELVNGANNRNKKFQNYFRESVLNSGIEHDFDKIDYTFEKIYKDEFKNIEEGLFKKGGRTIMPTISTNSNSTEASKKIKKLSEDYKEKEISQMIKDKISFIARERPSNNNYNFSFVSSNIFTDNVAAICTRTGNNASLKTPFSIKEQYCDRKNSLEKEKLLLSSAGQGEISYPINNEFSVLPNESLLIKDKVNKKTRTKKFLVEVEKDKTKESHHNISIASIKSKKSKNSKIPQRKNTNNSRSSKNFNVASKHQQIYKRAETNRQLVSLNKYSYVFDDVDNHIQSSRLNFTIKDVNEGKASAENDLATTKPKLRFTSKNLKTLHKNINFRRKDELD